MTKKAKTTPTTITRVSRQPSSALLAEVRNAFDAEMLVHLCETDDFSDYATKVSCVGPLDPRSRDRFYWYQDNGSKVLAVAHLDNVQDDPTCQVIDTAAGPLVVSGALDDRLGAYVILDLLPRLGITCDWLLTTDEEIGRSTASDFADDYEGKDYNWIIEFDRGGTDVVMYQYETPEYVGLVEDAGARVGMGSYSDIADLDDLGCAALNWGVGYEDYHSPRAHAWLNDTFKMVARFVQFYKANAETHLPHKGDDREWWKNYDLIEYEADCGHMIDLDDEASYFEWASGEVVCYDCVDRGLTSWPSNRRDEGVNGYHGLIVDEGRAESIDYEEDF